MNYLIGFIGGGVLMFLLIWFLSEDRKKYYAQKLKDMNEGNISTYDEVKKPK